jgi:hypothetical protein
VAGHPQLGAYQVAVSAGGFDAGTEAGGAVLVQLGSGRRVKVQRQPPPAESAEPDWARRLVLDVAERMAGSVFTAAANRRCGACPVQGSCPVQTPGRQVTQ